MGTVLVVASKGEDAIELCNAQLTKGFSTVPCFPASRTAAYAFSALRPEVVIVWQPLEEAADTIDWIRIAARDRPLLKTLIVVCSKAGWPRPLREPEQWPSLARWLQADAFVHLEYGGTGALATEIQKLLARRAQPAGT